MFVRIESPDHVAWPIMSEVSGMKSSAKSRMRERTRKSRSQLETHRGIPPGLGGQSHSQLHVLGGLQEAMGGGKRFPP